SVSRRNQPTISAPFGMLGCAPRDAPERLAHEGLPSKVFYHAPSAKEGGRAAMGCPSGLPRLSARRGRILRVGSDPLGSVRSGRGASAGRWPPPAGTSG